jgi:molybdenum cofactor cytidylyltransferase
MPVLKMAVMSKPKTAGIILAAGESKRFGRPKQLAEFRGKPLLEWVIDASVESDLDQVVLVLGHAHERILSQLDKELLESDICTFINHDYKMGQSSSLRLGLTMVRADHEAVMFLLADQPMVDAALLNLLITAHQQSPQPICVPVSDGRRGTPVIFGSEYFDALMKTEGDRGGRELLRANPQDVHEVEIKDPFLFVDIDTPDDLVKMEGRNE